ncbi:MBL fold metallo-hydrolase [Aestuariimicrobium soli]|uniref:MBL fold metallo-hydrolase n=1 Tax=Aestuariimicrobium soli TaxID=2035834 RepID=UPI003EBC12E4
MSARIDHTTTSGTFSLDGGTWEVDNNVWVVGDDHECVVIDAPHDDSAIAELVAGRRVVAVLLTHAHDDHIRATRELTERLGAPVWLHADDRMLWDLVFPDLGPDGELVDGQVIEVAGIDLTVLHTPGHSPGSCCFHVPDLGVVFTGDTLFQGGPGATGRSWSSFETIIESIKERLLTLPADTVVHTGHGESTTIADEAPHLQEWIDRGH